MRWSWPSPPSRRRGRRALGVVERVGLDRLVDGGLALAELVAERGDARSCLRSTPSEAKRCAVAASGAIAIAVMIESPRSVGAWREITVGAPPMAPSPPARRRRSLPPPPPPPPPPGVSRGYSSITGGAAVGLGRLAREDAHRRVVGVGAFTAWKYEALDVGLDLELAAALREGLHHPPRHLDAEARRGWASGVDTTRPPHSRTAAAQTAPVGDGDDDGPGRGRRHEQRGQLVVRRVDAASARSAGYLRPLVHPRHAGEAVHAQPGTIAVRSAPPSVATKSWSAPPPSRPPAPRRAPWTVIGSWRRCDRPPRRRGCRRAHALGHRLDVDNNAP